MTQPTIVSLLLLVSLAGRLAAASPTVFQSTRDFGCTEWHDCRRLALAAAERGDYQAFHDLAWRTVQTGPPKDPALMYLLARAQALSGRPHDALVMLQRLAEMGVASDAATNDDFVRTRQLPEWPEVSARIERLNHPDSSPPAPAAAVASSVPSKSPPSPALSPAPPSSAPSPAPGPEGSRFSTEDFTLGGLAYDAVSRRFLFGDRLGRKLIVAREGTDHAVDFVRADSAGFRDIVAIQIDGRRGDLWVISAAPADGAATLHKLQLVSGRPLNSFPVAADLEPLTLVDLAVTAAGAVFVLDSAKPQLLVLSPGRTAVEHVMKVDAVEPRSLAVAGNEGIAMWRIATACRESTCEREPRRGWPHRQRSRWLISSRSGGAVMR